MSMRALDPVRSVKVKLGVLVAASVTVASVVAAIGSGGGVPVWLGLPVTIASGLAVTQLLAVGMTSPLREMTVAAGRMAGGDHAVRVTATSRDEVGELARAFNRMAEELEEVDRHRRELVANVSHELRTPLAALCAVLENLADGVAEPDPQTLRATLAQAERMAALVADLLDLSRADAGRAPVQHRAVEVRALLDAVAAEPRVAGRGVTYVVDADPEPVVRGDPGRLGQLVANLLDNAARHSPPGGTVSVGAGVDGDRWYLVVADEGPGVAPADRERAFARFGTLAETEGGGGTGLGLAIARWVTDLHGGTIAFVDPEPGSTGARVRAEMPRDPRDASVELPPAAEPRPPAPVEVPTLTDAAFGDRWPDRAVAGSPPILAAAAGVGVLAGAVLPYRDPGVGTFVLLLAAGATLLGAARSRRDPFSLTCAALCAVLASVTIVRDADWVLALCFAAGMALCAIGLVRPRRATGLVLACLAWPLAGWRGLPWLGRTMRRLTGGGSAAALLRTAVWSTLGIVVFAVLFASADALFAEWVGALVPDLGSPDAALRAFIAVAIGGIVLAGAYLALDPPVVDTEPAPRRAVSQRFEWLVPVLVVDAVFALFLVAQATVIFGGHDYLERTTGLSYAEYVHQGFGQLTVATALTLLVVWAATRKAPRETAADRAWIRGSLGVLCGLTLVVVASALYRMHVYQDAYGFTRLRLLVDVFEGWLGLLVVATMAGGVALRAAWLPRFGVLSGVVLMICLAAVNPDAWIARHNIDRYEESGRIDWTYLRGLSADATGALATLPDDRVRCALDVADRPDDDWLEWNLGRSRASDVLDDGLRRWPEPTACPGQTDD